MWKSLWPVLVHRIVLIALSFIAAKFAIAHDVAAKLMAGDTVQLWAGAPDISMSQIENYLLYIGVPALISVALAGWARIKSLFALIKARLSSKSLTAGQVKEIVADTSTAEILQTVIAKP